VTTPYQETLPVFGLTLDPTALLPHLQEVKKGQSDLRPPPPSHLHRRQVRSGLRQPQPPWTSQETLRKFPVLQTVQGTVSSSHLVRKDNTVIYFVPMPNLSVFGLNPDPSALLPHLQEVKKGQSDLRPPPLPPSHLHLLQGRSGLRQPQPPSVLQVVKNDRFVFLPPPPPPPHLSGLGLDPDGFLRSDLSVLQEVDQSILLPPPPPPRGISVAPF
jgi:hypothetical protein